MLPKHRRLNSLEVREVLKEGRSRRALYLSMRYLVADVPLKTSAVVSKKVASKATERNRLRRAVYRALISPPVSKVTQAIHGKAVLFVQKVPSRDLTGVFAEDIANLFKNISI